VRAGPSVRVLAGDVELGAHAPWFPRGQCEIQRLLQREAAGVQTVVESVRDGRDPKDAGRFDDLGHGPDALVVLQSKVAQNLRFRSHHCYEARGARRLVRVGASHVQHGHAVGVTEQLEHAGDVVKLRQAALDHLRCRAGGVDVLAGVHREPYAKTSRQLPEPAQLLAVLDLPVIRKGRVGGEGDQVLSHPEQLDAVLRVPPQDGLQIRDVLPDEPLEPLHVREARQPQRAVRSRRNRQVLRGITETYHDPGIQRLPKAHCVRPPTNDPKLET
jgi:hypothetical protein